MFKKILRVLSRVAIVLVVLGLAFVVVAYFYMQKDLFGKPPTNGRLTVVKRSWHYRNGAFQNIHVTPELAEGYSMWDVTYSQFFRTAARRTPVDLIPSVKTDLLHLPKNKNVLAWFGHSSYFIQLDGKTILVDPVFSGNASPVPGTVPSFSGTDIYTVADLPPIDYLFISHDHYDHVDYETVLALKTKVRKVICGLGVGSHFESWGFDPEQIIERDWNEKIELDSGYVAYTAPARHFSGRTLTRNNTLWMSYVVQSPTMKIYIGGDSGYDTHYATIGNTYGPIDLAILDNGQYNSAWRYVHNLPGEVLQAARDLKAKRLFPVHSSKFVLANHAWDEPLVKVSELNKAYHFPLVTPMIGELVHLDDTTQVFTQWWVGVR